MKPFDAAVHMEKGTHKVPKSASQAVHGEMQLNLLATHRAPHGASRLVQAMSSWSVKSRRAPSRHCKDAKVYGHAAMHTIEYTPPP